MARTAVLLLGLAALCRAQFPPPTVSVSLDQEPEERWMPLLKVFNADYLKKAAATIIE